MTAAAEERAKTWAADIATTLLPRARRKATTHDLRFHDKGSLVISTADGAWYDHAAGRGGISAVRLIAHLKGCSARDALDWAVSWLASHPGNGSCNLGQSDGPAEAAAEARAEFARFALKTAVPVDGTPAAKYLESRGIKPPYPANVRYLPNARLGEGALVGVLTVGSDPVGIQVGYVDPRGRKSTIEPSRRVYLLDRDRGPSGTFELRSAGDGFATNDVILAEGIEDALSLAQVRASSLVLGVPGVGRMRNLEPGAGNSVTIVRDGDLAGSNADKALTNAVDHLLLRGLTVRVSNTPAGDDANSILNTAGDAALLTLVATAETADLSFEGEVQRLARMSAIEYELARNQAARRRGVRTSMLDEFVKQARPRSTPDVEHDPLADAPWDGEVNLLNTLDAALVEMQRYVVADQDQLAAAVVWAAHAHIVHSEAVRIPISPKMAIQAPERGCGKTTLLEVVGCLTPRSILASSITAASVFRVIEAEHPTVLLDEADRILSGKPDELIAVLNSSHRKGGAFVMRTEAQSDGTYKAIRFSTWAAVAFASIGTLPDTLQDRSIIIMLRRALEGEVADHLRDGSSPALTNIRRQMIAWGETLADLPDPEMPPGLYNRLGDNWRPLLAIADLAGGRWPDLIGHAARASMTIGTGPGRLTVLLKSIRDAFVGEARLSTADLIGKLLADPEEDWGTVNRGKPITPAWLRERLTNLLQPACAQRWKQKSKDVRGYYGAQFEDAWKRYLPAHGGDNLPPSFHPPHPPLTPKEPGGEQPEQVMNSVGQTDNVDPESAVRPGVVDAEAGGADEIAKAAACLHDGPAGHAMDDRELSVFGEELL